MEQIPLTNQPLSEDLGPQKREEERDIELAMIIARLRETALYAINPNFKEELRKQLLQQFAEYRATETKSTESMDDILCSPLALIAADIAKLPDRERNALLSDLAKRLPTTEKRESLKQAFQQEGLQLHDGTPQPHENDPEHNILLSRAYKHIINLLEQFHGEE